MKKSLYIFLLLFMATGAFAQPKYFNSTQIGIFMGNRQYSEAIPYYPYYGVLSSSVYIPTPYTYYYNTRSETQFSPSLTMTHGIQWNDHWATGIGIGYEIWDRNLYPLFADVRFTLWSNKISPFFMAKSGYALSHFKKKRDDWTKYGGLMVQPEMGVKVPLNESAELLFTVAYRYQKTKSMLKNGDRIYYDEWIEKERLNRLSFGVAILFK